MAGERLVLTLDQLASRYPLVDPRSVRQQAEEHRYEQLLGVVEELVHLTGDMVRLLARMNGKEGGSCGP